MRSFCGLAAFCCMLVLGAGLAFAQALLSPQQFRDAGVARIRQQHPEAVVTLHDSLGISVSVPGGGPGDGAIINYDSAYRTYLADPAQLEPLLDRWTRLAFGVPDDPQTRERIVSVVRGRMTVEGYNTYLQRGAPPSHVVARPLTGDLFEVLAFDSPEALAYVTPERLTELGITEDQAFALGRANLPARMGNGIETQTFPEAPGLIAAGGANGLAPSNLLLDFCDGPFARYLVLVANRDSYFMAEPDRPGNFEAFRRWAQSLANANETESATVLACQGGHLAAESF